MKKLLLTLCLGLIPMLANAETSSAVDDFLASLQGIESLQGEFLQRQYAVEGGEPVESRGRFRLLRPGYFAWEIRSPDSQVIIADPKYIWHHDLDLETVTRRPVSTGGNMSPLQILGGDEAILRSDYQVERTASGEFVLTPTASDPGFRSLTLHLQNSQVSGMELVDSLGQKVSIEFSSLDSTTALAPTDFAFAPPPEADLFYYDE